ncbi:MAG: tetratricopeptide repeat protein [Mangrovicoccus sp.]
MKQIIFAFAVCVATGAAAAPLPLPNCPPPLEFSERKSDLMEALQGTRDASAGRFLTRSLLEIWATAPNRHAQDMLDEGMSRRESKDFAGAIRAFDRLIAYCPTYAEGYNQRAFLYFMDGNVDLALRDLDAALERAPDHFGAMAGKAISLIRLGQVEQGRLLLERALVLNPWLPERFMLDDLPGEEV